MCLVDVKFDVFLLLYDVGNLLELVLEDFFIVLVLIMLLLKFLIRIFFEEIIDVGGLFFVVGFFIFCYVVFFNC